MSTGVIYTVGPLDSLGKFWACTLHKIYNILSTGVILYIGPLDSLGKFWAYTLHKIYNIYCQQELYCI